MAPPLGHTVCCTSSCSGVSTLRAPDLSAQPVIESKCVGCWSVGCQRQPGRAAAKCAACWPVPLAISSAEPVGPSNARSCARMGPWLRSAAGLLGSEAVVMKK